MNEDQFNEFLEEFSKMRDEVVLSIGTQGLADIKSRQYTKKEERDMRIGYNARVVQSGSSFENFNDPRDPVFMNLSKIEENTDTTNEDLRKVGSILDGMRGQIFYVNLKNGIQNIVMPLYERLIMLQEDYKVFDKRLHNEQVAFLNGIITSLKESDNALGLNFAQGIRRQYELFMKHPIWNTIIGSFNLVKNIVTPILSFGAGLLFGFKDSKSIEQQTLDEIKNQTEIMLSGKITPKDTGLMAFFRRGLLPNLGRAISSSFGFTLDKFQKKQDKERETGEKEGSWFSNAIQSRLFSKSTVKSRTEEAKQSNVNINEINDKDAKSFYQLSRFPEDVQFTKKSEESIATHIVKGFSKVIKEAFTDLIKGISDSIKYISDTRPENEKRFSDEYAHLGDIVLDSNGNVIGKLDEFNSKVDEAKEHLRLVMEASAKADEARHQQIITREDDILHNEMIQKAKDAELEKKKLGIDEKSLTLLQKIRSDSNTTAKEAVRARHARFFSMVGNVFSGIAGTLTSIAMAVGGLVVSLAPIAVLLGSKMIGKAWGLGASALAGLRGAGAATTGGVVSGASGAAGLGAATAAGSRGISRMLGPAATIGVGAIDAGLTIADSGLTTTQKAVDVGQIVGDTASTIGGAKLGTMIGTAIAPGVGTIVGGLIGGIGGYLASNSFSGFIAEKVNSVGLSDSERARMVEIADSNRYSDISKARDVVIGERTSESSWFDRIKEGLINPIAQSDFVQNATSKVSEAGDYLKENAQRLVSEGTDLASSTVASLTTKGQAIIASTADTTVNDIKQQSEGLFQRVGTLVSDKTSALVGSVSGMITSGYKSITEKTQEQVTTTTEGTFSLIREKFNGFLARGEEIKDRTVHSITEMTGRLSSEYMDDIASLTSNLFKDIQKAADRSIREYTNRVTAYFGSSFVIFSQSMDRFTAGIQDKLQSAVDSVVASSVSASGGGSGFLGSNVFSSVIGGMTDALNKNRLEFKESIDVQRKDATPANMLRWLVDMLPGMQGIRYSESMKNRTESEPFFSGATHKPADFGPTRVVPPMASFLGSYIMKGIETVLGSSVPGVAGIRYSDSLQRVREADTRPQEPVIQESIVRATPTRRQVTPAEAQVTTIEQPSMPSVPSTDTISYEEQQRYIEQTSIQKEQLSKVDAMLMVLKELLTVGEGTKRAIETSSEGNASDNSGFVSRFLGAN